MIESCENCKYWTREIEDNGNGNCHRNSPILLRGMVEQNPEEDIFNAVWPITCLHDWCGEYSVKNNKNTLINISNTSIEFFHLTCSIHYGLINNGIETIGDLTDHTYMDLYRIRGIGKTSINKIKEELLFYGLSLKNEQETSKNS